VVVIGLVTLLKTSVHNCQTSRLRRVIEARTTKSIMSDFGRCITVRTIEFCVTPADIIHRGDYGHLLTSSAELQKIEQLKLLSIMTKSK
jgi:hypothetical protein